MPSPTAANLPGIGLLHQMTRWEDGVIIVATMLLFPTTAALWGGSELFFLAKERVEKRYKERGIKEGIPIGVAKGREEGRHEERERWEKWLKEQGIDARPE